MFFFSIFLPSTASRQPKARFFSKITVLSCTTDSRSSSVWPSKHRWRNYLSIYLLTSTHLTNRSIDWYRVTDLHQELRARLCYQYLRESTATRFRPPSATVVSAEPFSHGTGTLQKEMATYRHWSVSLWRDPDDVSHCRILSHDKTEWWLISATLCGWGRCFVADQLW